MKNFLKLIFLLAVVHSVFGCATSINNQILKKSAKNDYANMYLRGIFNWWEATPSYKLQPITSTRYSVTFELIADGQPYDFKVADSNWSMHLNCGNRFGAKEMELNKSRKLVCAHDSVNLQFTPIETSNYQFIFDVADNQQPTITIKKV